MKPLIKKILEENLKRIIITDQNKSDYDLNESFDKPIKDFKIVDDFTYTAEEGDIKGIYTFRLDFDNGYLDQFKHEININDVGVFYDFSWRFHETVDKHKNPFNWVKLTTTGFKILDDFIRKQNPKLIKLGDKTDGNFKLYFNDSFINKLQSLFYHNYYVKPYPHISTILIIKKDLLKLDEDFINYRMEVFGDSEKDANDYRKYPHKRKRQMKGIIKNDYRKEQIKRIINKVRYL